MMVRRRSVEELRRELEARQAKGLLDPKIPGLGLLAGAVPTDAPASGPSPIEEGLLRAGPARAIPSNNQAGLLANTGSAPSAAPSPKPSGGGLLATGQKSPGAGLLAVGPSPARGPAEPEARNPAARVGNFLDDFFLDGVMGERSEQRRLREEARAASEAHRDAFAYASGPEGFDPARYQVRMAELGQAPGIGDLVNLEGVSDGQDVRGLRQRQEERGVTAGALAPVTRLPEDQRAGALSGVADYLGTQGYNFDPNTNMAGINAAVGAGMGADSWLDNERGDRNLAEQQRAAQSAESFRNSDLGFRKDESRWERQYREGRAAADDSYRAEELDVRREALAVPNSTGDVIAPILSKVATMGLEALTEGERLIWERYQQSGQNPFAALMGAPGAAPVPTPQPSDPFPGISEGESIQQDGKTYVRRGNQMIEVR